MSSRQKTLWMGNIEKWMNRIYITKILNNLNIYPKKVLLKNNENKRGCAFLEFDTKEKAEFVLKNFQGIIINGLEFKFNWVKSKEEKKTIPKITKFTVISFNIIVFF